MRQVLTIGSIFRAYRLFRAGSESDGLADLACNAVTSTSAADAAHLGAAAIAKAALTTEDRVREVIGNLNADGFSSLSPKDQGGRPPKFTLAQRRERWGGWGSNPRPADYEKHAQSQHALDQQRCLT